MGITEKAFTSDAVGIALYYIIYEDMSYKIKKRWKEERDLQKLCLLTELNKVTSFHIKKESSMCKSHMTKFALMYT
jgi:hypothetical protein